MRIHPFGIVQVSIYHKVGTVVSTQLCQSSILLIQRVYKHTLSKQIPLAAIPERPGCSHDGYCVDMLGILFNEYICKDTRYICTPEEARRGV